MAKNLRALEAVEAFIASLKRRRAYRDKEYLPLVYAAYQEYMAYLEKWRKVYQGNG